MHIHSENLLNVFPNIDNICYLSPDGSEILETVEINTIYVIAGIVDRTIIKNLSFNKSQRINGKQLICIQ